MTPCFQCILQYKLEYFVMALKPFRFLSFLSEINCLGATTAKEPKGAFETKCWNTEVAGTWPPPGRNKFQNRHPVGCLWIFESRGMRTEKASMQRDLLST